MINSPGYKITEIAKACRSISSEIDLEKLLIKIMKIFLEHTGAQRGYLILEKDGDLKIEAAANANTNTDKGDVEAEVEVTVLLSIPINKCQELPETIISYASRTGENVLLHNAVEEGEFTHDPYILENHPTSILCTPIKHKEKLFGLLYLENNRMTHAFTEERIEMLHVLLSQATLSLENVRLLTEITALNKNLQKETEERKRTGGALLESEKHFKSVVETATESIITIDENTNVVSWNPAAEKMFGFSEEEMHGNPLTPIVPKKLHDRHEKAIKRVFETGKLHLKGHPVELTGIRKDGSKFPLEISMTLWKTTKNMFVTGIIRDITFRKQVEEQLRQSQKMASLGILASGVAHEINNPNNSIMLNAAALLEIWENLAPAVQKYYQENKEFTVKGIGYNEISTKVPKLFEGISDASKRIKIITRDLRDFARSEPMDVKKNLDINKIVKSAVSLVHNLITISTNHFSVHYGKSLPGINGNFQKLEQVFVNLLQNAAQALTDKNHKITLSTSLDKERKNIVVKIEDEGVGISPSNLENIMDPFYTTKRENGGTGLGLSIASSIVRDHSGSLDFESTPGKGTIATVTIPAIVRSRQ
jgi:PAS domain S-box-containing protein